MRADAQMQNDLLAVEWPGVDGNGADRICEMIGKRCPPSTAVQVGFCESRPLGEVGSGGAIW